MATESRFTEIFHANTGFASTRPNSTHLDDILAECARRSQSKYEDEKHRRDTTEPIDAGGAEKRPSAKNRLKRLTLWGKK
jgi:hypothetical protein